MVYEITLKGRAERTIAAAFDEFEVSTEPGSTVGGVPTMGVRLTTTTRTSAGPAVQVLQVIDGLLQFLGSRELDVAEILDDDWAVAIVVDLPSWEQYIEGSFDDLIAAGSHAPRLLARVNEVLALLGEHVLDERRAALSARVVPSALASGGRAEP